MHCCPRGLRQLCIRKMFRSMLAACAILVLCNVVAEAPSNIAQENIQAIQAMSFEQNLVTFFTYLCIRSFTSKKNIKLCFLYYENRLKLTLKLQLGFFTQQPVLSASHAMLPKPCNLIKFSCDTVKILM